MRFQLKDVNSAYLPVVLANSIFSIFSEYCHDGSRANVRHSNLLESVNELPITFIST